MLPLAFILAILLLGWLSPHPYTSWLHHLGVPAQAHVFGDLGVIAHAIEVENRGGSIYPSATPESRNLSYNYPRLWLQWGRLGLRPDTVPIWGVLAGLMFLGSAVCVARPLTHTEGLYLGALLCSPVCLLLLERANNDTVVFAVIAWGVVFVRHPLIGIAATLVGACGKLYPIAAIVALAGQVRRPGHRLALFGTTAALFTLYLLLSIDQWAAVYAVTPRIPHWSFGTAVAGQWLAAFCHFPLSRAAAMVGGTVSVLLALIAIGVLVRRLAPMSEALPLRTLKGLLAGTAVVGFAYLLGNTFQYRIVFLLLCLPAAWVAARSVVVFDRRAGVAALGLVAVYFWWDAIAGESTLAGALAKQAVIFLLLCVLTTLGVRALRHGPRSEL